MGSRTPRPALIEQNNSVAGGIEKTPVFVVTTRPRTAVHKQHRHAAGIAGLLGIQPVPTPHTEGVHMVRLDLRIEFEHGRTGSERLGLRLQVCQTDQASQARVVHGPRLVGRQVFVDLVLHIEIGQALGVMLLHRAIQR